MKFLKKNQIAIYALALMLVVAGYLNFTSTNDLTSVIQTSSSEEELMQMANIGDAQLVSSNDIVEEDFTLNGDINSNNNSDYFYSSKLERDTMYSQMIETYENILNSNNSLETQKQSAQEEIKKINDIKNSIMISENLIKTKGFKNVVIFVNGESVSVIVEDEQLNQEEVAQIQNIIAREINAEADNIHISNK